jgi:3-hydroxyisobutyrate dehydrogenase-like beta-hydroxyacid dehydrogenase
MAEIVSFASKRGEGHLQPETQATWIERGAAPPAARSRGIGDAMTQAIRIALIGLGEARVGAARVEDARAAGVRAATAAADAARRADVVISAVTADATAAVAEQAAGYLRPGQVFLDINSASPGTKRAAAHKIEAAGAHYVEGAVMASVPGPGLRVPILAGGPAAAVVADRLNGYGMNITAVSPEHGRASAMKLCRSIVIKGLEALMLDCAAAAASWKVESEVFGSLQATFPSIDFARLSVDMAGRVRKHGIRRAAEMREAASMVEDLGRDPSLIQAIAGAQERGAAR